MIAPDDVNTNSTSRCIFSQLSSSSSALECERSDGERHSTEFQMMIVLDAIDKSVIMQDPITGIIIPLDVSEG